MSLRSHIADLNHGLAGELLLDVEVVVLHVGRFDIAIKGENIALKAAAAESLARSIKGSLADSIARKARIKNEYPVRAKLLYAGPGSKKGEKGRWPSTMSWEKAS